MVTIIMVNGKKIERKALALCFIAIHKKFMKVSGWEMYVQAWASLCYQMDRLLRVHGEIIKPKAKES